MTDDAEPVKTFETFSALLSHMIGVHAGANATILAAFANALIRNNVIPWEEINTELEGLLSRMRPLAGSPDVGDALNIGQKDHQAIFAQAVLELVEEVQRNLTLR